MATLPEGWKDRLVSWELQSSKPADPHFLDPYDLAVSKLAAGRQKDLDFVLALIRGCLLDVAEIRERAALLPTGTDPVIRERIEAWLNYHCSKK